MIPMPVLGLKEEFLLIVDITWKIVIIVLNLLSLYLHAHSRSDICLLLMDFANSFTLGRRQAKMLLIFDECGSKIARNSAFDCNR